MMEARDLSGERIRLRRNGEDEERMGGAVINE